MTPDENPSPSSEAQAGAEGATPVEQVPSEAAAPATEEQAPARPSLADISDDELLADPRVSKHIDSLVERAEARGFQTAQSQIDTARAAEAARQQAQTIHDQMENLRVSDPGKFAELMANPKIKKAYTEWRKIEESEALDAAARQATVESFDAIATAFRQLPHLSKLSQKDWDALAEQAVNARSGPEWAATFLNKERALLEASVTAEVGKKAKDDAMTELRAEMRRAGIDDSALESGHPADTSQLTIAEINRMSVKKIRELERSGELDKALARGQ